MIPYTYYLIHIPSGLKYYGVKYGNKADPNTFWKENGYFTSSLIVKALLRQDGPNSFFAEIRKTFSTKEEAIGWEQKVLHRLKITENSNWLNQAYGTGPYRHKGRYTEEEKKILYSTRRGKPKSPEHRSKIAAAHQGKKKPRTPEWQEKITKALQGRPVWNRGVEYTDEQKEWFQKRVQPKRGPMSQKQKDAISKAKREKVSSGWVSPLKGRAGKGGKNHHYYGKNRSESDRLAIGEGRKKIWTVSNVDGDVHSFKGAGQVAEFLGISLNDVYNNARLKRFVNGNTIQRFQPTLDFPPNIDYITI